MADQQISSELRNALESGAEVSIARILAAGGDEEALSDFIANRLNDLDTGDILYIVNLARQMLASAELISDTDDEEFSDPDLIPTNPFLFGSDTAGKRLFWIGEWNIPGKDEWYGFSGYFPDVPSYDELQDIAQELAQGWAEMYPERFGIAEDQEMPQVNVNILAVEKAF